MKMSITHVSTRFNNGSRLAEVILVLHNKNLHQKPTYATKDPNLAQQNHKHRCRVKVMVKRGVLCQVVHGSLHMHVYTKIKWGTKTCKKVGVRKEIAYIENAMTSSRGSDYWRNSTYR